MTEAGLPNVSFHDSEVLAIRLDRAGPTMEVVVEVFPQTESSARYTLRFSDVADLEMGGINEQNVLFDLAAVPEGDGWAVRFEPTYGVGATFRCEQIEADRSA